MLPTRSGICPTFGWGPSRGGRDKGFLEDRFATWQDLVLETEEILDLGRGVVFAPVREEDRPEGSAGHLAHG